MSKEPLVTLPQGRVEGRICEDIRGGEFYSFQGIPYGKPPVGKFRFKAPQPAGPWTGVYDATQEGNPSIQKHYLTKEMIGSEDCLNLSVYTKNLPSELGNYSTQLKPVMVFVHGGAFAQGSNKTEVYGPEFLMPEDVVLVVINYRLGFLGFLSLEDPSLNIPGNAAFKDMVLALQWVQKNISNFNGDHNNVTVFGESAGAAAAHLLMLSPMSQGLLHKVIAQSGCAINSWIYGRRVAVELARDMGFNSDSEGEVLEFLQKANVEELFRGQMVMDEKDIMANQPRYIGFVVEKPSSEEPAFFTTPPLDIMVSGKFNKLPLMIGYNNTEGMLFDILVKKDKQSIYWTDKETNVPGLLNLEKGTPVSKVVADKIVRFYLGSGKITKETHTRQLYDITTDNCFLRGIYSSVKNHAGLPNAPPVYMYRMSIESNLNIYKRLTGIQQPGVNHADDLGYLFKNLFTPEVEPNSIEDVGQRRFARLWANFARYGKPTVEADPLLDVDWKPVEKNKMHFLEIGEKLKMDCNPEPKRMAFWDEIFRISPVTSKL